MLNKMIWNPSERQLRQFGGCALFAAPLLGWAVLGRSAPADWTGTQSLVFAAFTAVGLLAGLLAWLRPQALKPAFVGLTLVTMPIGMVVGELLLVLVYFGIFTPVALLFRLIGRDALQRRFEPDATTYWTPVQQSTDAKQYFRQS